MIEFTTGNILTANTQALVNTVNCVGIMGRGLAFQFKNKFPANFRAYQNACARKEIRPGKMFVFEIRIFANPKFIVNFPTKRDWRDKSRMEDIDSGLVALVDEIRERDIDSIAIPPLGCGLGGLNWTDVRQRIETIFDRINAPRVLIFEPKGRP